MNEPVYTSFDGKTLSVKELKELNIDLYNSLTSYRCLLRGITQKDIKHIFITILESNSTYFVVGNDRANMDSTLVFGKVDLIRILKNYEFDYGISCTDYDDYLLSLVLKFKKTIPEFGNSNEIEIFLSYDDLAQLVRGINLGFTMLNHWKYIEHAWAQKRLFKDLD